jgi:predicted nucleotidyltransferase
LTAEDALKDIDLQSKLPLRAAEVFDFREEYIRNKNLIAWNFINLNNPAESVDIIITEDLRKMKAKRILVGDQILRVVSIEDLIKMKKKSSRPQDLEDIKALRRLKK